MYLEIISVGIYRKTKEENYARRKKFSTPRAWRPNVLSQSQANSVVDTSRKPIYRESERAQGDFMILLALTQESSKDDLRACSRESSLVLPLKSVTTLEDSGSSRRSKIPRSLSSGASKPER